MTTSKKTAVIRVALSEARRRLPEFARTFARDPHRVVVVTRRGRPVLELVAPARVASQTSAARRILKRVARLENRAATTKLQNVAGRYKDFVHGRT